MKPLRPCRYPGCRELTRSGWCSEHKPKRERVRSAEYHSWYNLSIWTDRLRPQQLLREPFCRECARHGIRTAATVVDHIVPHGGVWSKFVDADNLQSLCKHHHDQKTAQEMMAFTQRNGAETGSFGRSGAWAQRRAREDKPQACTPTPRQEKTPEMVQDRMAPFAGDFFPTGK